MLYIHYHVTTTENKHSQKRIAFTSNDDNQVKLKSLKVRTKRGRCENTLSIVMAEGMRLLNRALLYVRLWTHTLLCMRPECRNVKYWCSE